MKRALLLIPLLASCVTAGDIDDMSAAIVEAGAVATEAVAAGVDQAHAGLSTLEQILLAVTGAAATIGAAVKATNVVRDGKRKMRKEAV